MMKNVLVTGASGFISANLVRRLLRDRYEVHCIVRKTSDLWRLKDVRDRLVLHVADLTAANEVAGVFAAVRPDVVFHLATTRADGRDFHAFFQGNVLTAANLIDACRMFPVSRLVVYGSSLEYGHRPEPLSETMACSPATLHGTTRLCATQLFLQAYRSFGLPIILLRLFSVYGPWEAPARLIPKALLAGLHSGSVQLTPQAQSIQRDFVFVGDVVEAGMVSLGVDAAIGEIINVGSGVQTSNETLISRIAELTGNTLRIDAYDYPRHETDAGYWVADTRKCQTLLGWSPATTLAEGLHIYREWISRHCHVAPYARSESIASV